MTLDLIVIAALTLFAVVGAFDGALAQGARLVAIVIAGLLGRPLGEHLAPAVEAATDLPTGLVGPLTIGLCTFGLFLILGFAGRRIARGLTRDHQVRAADRGAGAFFGALQAAVIAWIAVSALVRLEAMAHRSLGGEGSLAARLAREHDFFGAVAQVRDQASEKTPVSR